MTVEQLAPRVNGFSLTACGQTRTHLPHWMQSASSQAGISAAMLRFSQRAVPLG